MNNLVTTATLSLVFAVSAIWRVDLILISLSKKAIAALFDGNSDAVSSAAEGLAADALDSDAESWRFLAKYPPESHVGRTKGELSRIYGAPCISDSYSDYFLVGHSTVVRFRFRGGVVFKAESSTINVSSSGAHSPCATIGASWEETLRDWGMPDYCEAGSWFYEARPSRGGVHVFFGHGVVTGSEDLPSFWRNPEHDDQQGDS